MTKPSSNFASNRVVSLNGWGRNRSPGHRILGECRDQLINKLSLWLREVVTPISEELFTLADSTRERLQQTRYLDLRASIEKSWPHLVENFSHTLSLEAECCQKQEIEKSINRETPFKIPDFDGLQLLADEELAEHIVIREFSAQLSESCDEELYPLNRRVAALLGCDELVEGINPLAPTIICRALSSACATIGSDADERLLLLRRLERHLHISLPPIYRQINAYLIERSVLPDLRRNYRKNPIQDEPKPTSSPLSIHIPANTPTASIPDVLRRLVLARTVHAGGSAGFATSPPGTIATQYPTGSSSEALDTGGAINPGFFSSLNAIQHASSGETEDLIINQVRMVRESEDARQVSGLAAVTLDIVAMLFDFIFDDAHIPLAIKALISRLQIPVLKIAMLNPGFFSDRQHPTRRFLGNISGISIRWGNSVDEADPFYNKLAELVEQIQAKFESDVEVFGTALTELEAFVNERENEEEATALTAANIVILREKETEAWERALRAVQLFRANNALPPFIDTFFREHWVSVLQMSAAKDGENAFDWKSNTETMKDLAWSIEAKRSADDRLKLVSMLPGLLAQLNKGFDRIDANPQQRSAFFDGLVQYHSAALKGERLTSPIDEIPSSTKQDNMPPDFNAVEEGELLVTHSVDNGVDVEEVVLVGANPAWCKDEHDIFRQVSDLKRGDWVEFYDEEGNTNRERLNWISPQRGILLFSNHRSSKAISIAPEALVRQIRDGKAIVLHEEQIFEQALSDALESLNASLSLEQNP